MIILKDKLNYAYYNGSNDTVKCMYIGIYEFNISKIHVNPCLKDNPIP